jgi:hypothetical protein
MHGGGPRKLVIFQVASSRAFTAEQRRNTTSTHASIRGRLGMGESLQDGWNRFPSALSPTMKDLDLMGRGLNPWATISFSF